jgi:NADPH:quinone reductase-like Zn-dependent oxidoreductase
MKSLHLTEAGMKPALIERDVPLPKPAEGEVLVRVRAAGIIPTEAIWYPTAHTKDGGKRIGAVPSHEFSGEIADTGHQVYGMNDWFADGALAEYCVTRPDWIAPKPKTLSYAEAASAPISALTAWQGLFERAALRAGERVLVHGGAGAVGVFAIQLARLRGAYVITTASAADLAFVSELGAAEAIDYKAGAFEEKVRDVDVVFDAVGGETLRRSWAVLKPSGRLVTIAASSEPAADERTKQAFFIVEPKREQLVETGRMFDAGELRTFVAAVLPWPQASDAYAGTVEHKGRGKLVVSV